jgi:hypothetical protein
MLTVKKELVNWVAWFLKKLQNKLIVIQCKVGKSISTLVRSALTIIGYYHHELFTRAQESATKERNKLQKQKEKIIVDVNAIMLENRKKKMNIINNSKQSDYNSIITSRRGCQ